jgi:hypothetical protein
MVDNRGKQPERVEMPVCNACMDYLIKRSEHLG